MYTNITTSSVAAPRRVDPRKILLIPVTGKNYKIVAIRSSAERNPTAAAGSAADPLIQLIGTTDSPNLIFPEKRAFFVLLIIPKVSRDNKNNRDFFNPAQRLA